MPLNTETEQKLKEDKTKMMKISCPRDPLLH